MFLYSLSQALSLFPFIPSFLLHVWRGPLTFFFPCPSARPPSLPSLFPLFHHFSLLHGSFSTLREALASGPLFLEALFIRFLGFSPKKVPSFLSRLARFLAPISFLLCARCLRVYPFLSPFSAGARYIAPPRASNFGKHLCR